MNPIGTATLTLLGYTGEATLHDDGTWGFAGDPMVTHHLKNAAQRLNPGAPCMEQLEQLRAAVLDTRLTIRIWDDKPAIKAD